MTRHIVFRAVLLAVVLCNLMLLPALAMPPSLPSSFYGYIDSGDQAVEPGTLVTVWINGVQYAQTTVQFYHDKPVYSLNVSGDDPDTSAVVEGGRAGDLLEFHIGDLVADESSTWASGTNVRLDLTAHTDPSLMVAHPTQSPAPGVDGWNSSDVTVQWNWVDTGSGIDWSHCPSSSTSSGEGVLTLEATCDDLAGKTNVATFVVRVDKSAAVASPYTLFIPLVTTGQN